MRAGITHNQLLTNEYSVGSSGLAAQYLWLDAYTALEGNLKLALDTIVARERGFEYDVNLGVALGAMAEAASSRTGLTLGIGLGSDAISRPRDDATTTLPPALYGYLRPHCLLMIAKGFVLSLDLDASLRTSRSHALKARALTSIGRIRTSAHRVIRFNLGVTWQWYPDIELAEVGGLLGLEFDPY